MQINFEKVKVYHLIYSIYYFLYMEDHQHAISQPDALVFQGGGVLGLAYVGALDKLQNIINFDLIKKYAGNSIGSLFALVMACKIYNRADYIDLDPSKFLENGRFGAASGLYNLINKYGWYNSDKIRQWIGDLLVKNNYSADITFKQLLDKTGNELYIIATSLESTPHTKYFSHLHDPDMPIRTACIISACVPVLFEPILYDGKMYCDGGLVNNYPINIWENEDIKPAVKPKVLGLRLVKNNCETSPGGMPKIKSTFDLIMRVLSILYILPSEINLSKEDLENSILINTHDINSLNFNLTAEDKLKLIKAGEDATSIL
jgi:NTE family protein